MSRPRFLFAGNFHWNAGSSHVIAEYARASAAAGCEIGVSSQLSRLDGTVDAYLPLVGDVAWATHLVFVFEGRQFLSDRQREICETVARRQRIILDPDGHWGPHVRSGFDDSGGQLGAAGWRELYTSLGGLVLQPMIGGPRAGAEFFSYFGMPEIHRRSTSLPDPGVMRYELQYVGANWWRWSAVADLVRAAAAARPAVTRIRVCGRWWTGEPHPDHPMATANKAGWLAEQGVHVAPPVPFGQVVAEMAEAAITPVLVRPLLAELGLLTPRMFETLASGSLPVLPDELSYLSALYGDDIAPFFLGDDPSGTLARMLAKPDGYRRRLGAIQDDVHRRFNYRQVLTELVKFTR